MSTLIGVLDVAFWVVIVLMILLYGVLSIYICKPISMSLRKGMHGAGEITRKQKRDTLKAHLRSMKSALLTQSILAVFIAIAFLSLKHEGFSVAFAVLSAWKLIDYRTFKA